MCYKQLKEMVIYHTIMGRYIITKRHLTTIYVFLDSHMNLLSNMEKDLKPFNINNSKLLLFVKLLNVPTPKWISREEELLANVISYMLWATAQRIDEFRNCLFQIEKRAKDEYAKGIMVKDEYLEHRRINFELDKLFTALKANKGNATMTFDNWVDDKNEDRVNIET